MATTDRTTIQVDRGTLQLLEQLKKAGGASSLSDLIRQLIRERQRLKRAERGSLRKLPEFRRDKRDRLD